MELFISYCHKDEDFAESFQKILSPLVGEGKVLSNIWYDRKINVGEEFWNKIDSHLDDSDVICLLLSSDYLSSNSCKKEMNRALERHEKDHVLVIPVVLRPCGWLDENNRLSKLLGAPKDGKAISTFDNEDEAWMNVYNQVKTAVNLYRKQNEIIFKEKHKLFLNDATVFSKAHSNKTTLLLSDIFVYPDVNKIEKDNELVRLSSKKLIDGFNIGDRIVLIGEDQSGKTSLLKTYIKELRTESFFPIYVKDPAELLQGNFDYRLGNLFTEQYETDLAFEEIDKSLVIPIVDDFHKANNKTKVIQQLMNYNSCIVVVDDIYTFDIRNDKLAVFTRYRIEELKPTQRNELVKKWIMASDSPSTERTINNSDLQIIDETSHLIETTLGKVHGKGIMPAYAYFILTLLRINEDTNKPLEEKITSQGYCYQALIIMFLKKQNLSNAKIDSYINFLAEFASCIYDNNGQALNITQFEDFVNRYENNYSLTDPIDVILSKLESANLISKSSLGNFDFNYPYIYYFFVGKFFATAWEDSDDVNHDKAIRDVSTIVENLHKTSNAYIAVFIAHHTRNTALINLIAELAKKMFARFEPATMDKKCLSVFSAIESKIATPSLPSSYSPEENRQEQLRQKDEMEVQNKYDDYDDDDIHDEFALELRRSIKTVEVIGSIIKNRPGSLRIQQQTLLFEEAMDVQLRLVSSFLELVRRINESKDGTSFLEERILEVHPDIAQKELPIRAQQLFWGLNFAFLISSIKKICFSLGSSDLIRIIQNVCDKRNTPASYLIKHTILMWYKKNVQINELQKMDKILDNTTARNAMLWLITDYCRLHIIDYKDAAKLSALGIKKSSLLPTPNKEKR